MAPRTGADGLIASRAKVTSAGTILALVTAVVLVIPGCGESGSDVEATGASRSSPPATAGTAESLGSPKEAKAPASKGRSKSSNAGADDAERTSSAESASGAGKHGSHVAIPKGPPEPEPTAAQRANATLASIALASPAVQLGAEGEARLPSTYTCDGRDSWPALRWQGIPPDTAELVLFAMNIQPAKGKLFFDWALAGLDPELEGLDGGQLPKGAVTGQNSFGKTGYSICPLAGSETYIFALYALSRRLSPDQGFDPHALREEVLDASGNVGILAASYVRG